MRRRRIKAPYLIGKPAKYQTGSTTRAVDIRLGALKPGKRMSKNHNIYYEHRRNRSDKKKYL